MSNQITEKEFRKFRLSKRFATVQKDGKHLASRFFESFHVHLFAVGDFKVEVWYRISLSQVCYVEVVGNPETLQSYVKDIDLKELGL